MRKKSVNESEWLVECMFNVWLCVYVLHFNDFVIVVVSTVSVTQLFNTSIEWRIAETRADGQTYMGGYGLHAIRCNNFWQACLAAKLDSIRMAESGDSRFPHFGTRCIHEGQDPEQWESFPVVPPIFTNTTYKQNEPGKPVSGPRAKATVKVNCATTSSRSLRFFAL